MVIAAIGTVAVNDIGSTADLQAILDQLTIMQTQNNENFALLLGVLGFLFGGLLALIIVKGWKL